MTFLPDADVQPSASVVDAIFLEERRAGLVQFQKLQLRIFQLYFRLHVSKMSKFGVLIMGPAGAGKVCAFFYPPR